MDNIILIFLCLIAGIALQRVKAFPANSYVALNQYIIHIALPAMALYYIPKVAISSRLLFPLGVAWGGFLLSWVLFASLGRFYGWSKKLTGCLILTGGLGNTSFVGFPIIEALFGKEGLKTAIIVDQPGTFAVMATLGIVVAVNYSGGAVGTAGIVRRIVFFPPFAAVAIGMLINVSGYDFHDVLQPVLQRLGNTVTPVALIAVGMQLKIQRRNKHWGFLGLGLLYKLFLMPAVFFVLYKIIMRGKGMEIDVAVVEAAMAPMITACILASSHGLKPRLAGMMLGIGIPLSLLTAGLWYWLVRLCS